MDKYWTSTEPHRNWTCDPKPNTLRPRSRRKCTWAHYNANASKPQRMKKITRNNNGINGKWESAKKMDAPGTHLSIRKERTCKEWTQWISAKLSTIRMHPTWKQIHQMHHTKYRYAKLVTKITKAHDIHARNARNLHHTPVTRRIVTMQNNINLSNLPESHHQTNIGPMRLIFHDPNEERWKQLELLEIDRRENTPLPYNGMHMHTLMTQTYKYIQKKGAWHTT